MTAEVVEDDAGSMLVRSGHEAGPGPGPGPETTEAVEDSGSQDDPEYKDGMVTTTTESSQDCRLVVHSQVETTPTTNHSVGKGNTGG